MVVFQVHCINPAGLFLSVGKQRSPSRVYYHYKVQLYNNRLYFHINNQLFMIHVYREIISHTSFRPWTALLSPRVAFLPPNRPRALSFFLSV